MKEVISQEIIENFLNGGDPEEFIVGVEYDYPTNKIYKIIQDPEKGKIVKEDSFTPFLWVGDLSELNFYQGSKALQKRAMGQHGILIEKLETYGNERLEAGMKYLVKSLKLLIRPFQPYFLRIGIASDGVSSRFFEFQGLNIFVFPD